MFISVPTLLNNGQSEPEQDANDLILQSFGQLLRDNADLGDEFGEQIGFSGPTEEMVRDPDLSIILQRSVVPLLEEVDKEFKTQFAANLDKGIVVGDTSGESGSIGVFYLNIDLEAYTFVSIVVIVMSSKRPFDVYKAFGRFATTDDQLN